MSEFGGRSVSVGSRKKVSRPALPITLTEIRNTIKSTKQKSAGKSGITKAHIVNLPMNEITALRDT